MTAMTRAGRLHRARQGGLVFLRAATGAALALAFLFPLSIHAQLPVPPGAGPRIEEGLKGIQRPEDRIIQPEEPAGIAAFEPVFELVSMVSDSGTA